MWEVISFIACLFCLIGLIICHRKKYQERSITIQLMVSIFIWLVIGVVAYKNDQAHLKRTKEKSTDVKWEIKTIDNKDYIYER